MKVLVAVASRHGSTREIGDAVAEELRNSSIDAELRDVQDVNDLAGYDALLLGAEIYAGKWLPEASRFVEECTEELAEMPIWLFSSGPLGHSPQPSDDLEKIAAPMSGLKTLGDKNFVGKLDPAGLGIAERLIVKVVGAPAGDFREWEEIRSWARNIATELSALTPTPDVAVGQ
jgi:menaquinone-dependent protoporphyrinogen oxidase